MTTQQFSPDWFSDPQDTIEAAQVLYQYDLFNPAAVFELPDGKFAMGLIREMDTPPHQTATAVHRLVGYQMVSHADPLMGIWKPYRQEATG